jgi:hypothetical protein
VVLRDLQNDVFAGLARDDDDDDAVREVTKEVT